MSESCLVSQSEINNDLPQDEIDEILRDEHEIATAMLMEEKRKFVDSLIRNVDYKVGNNYYSLYDAITMIDDDIYWDLYGWSFEGDPDIYCSVVSAFLLRSDKKRSLYKLEFGAIEKLANIALKIYD